MVQPFIFTRRYLTVLQSALHLFITVSFKYCSSQLLVPRNTISTNLFAEDIDNFPWFLYSLRDRTASVVVATRGNNYNFRIIRPTVGSRGRKHMIKIFYVRTVVGGGCIIGIIFLAAVNYTTAAVHEALGHYYVCKFAYICKEA